MKPYTRADRVSNAIQTAITDLLSRKIQDPRLEMVTVSGVKLSPDLSIATVYVTVFGDDKRKQDALDGFRKSKGYIKKSIAPKLGLKFMPELRFFLDDTFDRAARLDALIDAAPKGEGREDTEDKDGEE
ncbi:MAG: 30S ribosome-binding factor RbfA [Desulfobacter sp.]|nr:MAG: 30S ribosome-binding factor RbfA [Desulfobacter sp.]